MFEHQSSPQFKVFGPLKQVFLNTLPALIVCVSIAKRGPHPALTVVIHLLVWQVVRFVLTCLGQAYADIFHNNRVSNFCLNLLCFGFVVELRLSLRTLPVNSRLPRPVAMNCVLLSSSLDFSAICQIQFAYKFRTRAVSVCIPLPLPKLKIHCTPCRRKTGPRLA